MTVLFEVERTLTRKMPAEISPIATVLPAASPAGPMTALGVLNIVASYSISTETAATETPVLLVRVIGRVILPPASPLPEPVAIVGATGIEVVVVDVEVVVVEVV